MTEKKRWGIKEPVQWKLGGWYSCIIDPSNNEVVHEIIGYSKQSVFNTCVEWAVQKNSDVADVVSTTVEISGGSDAKPE